VSSFLIIRPEAEEDLTEAFNWYEVRRAGLGYEFLDRVNLVLSKIEENPQRYSGTYRNVRLALLGRFPYKVLYMIEGRQAEVIGVVHVKRSPLFWQKRVSK
jgi:plasmid stabilization system protein ParE